MLRNPDYKIELSTGYEVPIDLNDPEDGLDHLTSALMGEIFTQAYKKFGLDKATQIFEEEIQDICNKLDEEQKADLLKSMLWLLVSEKYNEARKNIKSEEDKKN